MGTRIGALTPRFPSRALSLTAVMSIVVQLLRMHTIDLVVLATHGYEGVNNKNNNS